jgi:hypothetical protein
VIYTSARISLSERARDLASMRVLGFRKHEAGFVLLGEEAVLVLLSLPFGFAAAGGCAADGAGLPVRAVPRASAADHRHLRLRRTHRAGRQCSPRCWCVGTSRGWI